MAEGVQGSLGDYAANIGTTGADYTLQSESGDVPTNGVFLPFRGLSLEKIVDGTSNTFLIGEKHVPQDKVGIYPWDCGIFDGHNPVCNTRCGGSEFPLAASRMDQGWKFGSYHVGVCQFAFCDGSVRAIPNSINPTTLGLLAQRNDRQIIPDY